MSAVEDPPRSIADLLEQLGVSAERVRARPAPGTASEQDVVNIEARENRLYELVDGVLVEKVIGFEESLLAAELIRILGSFVKRHDLGLVAAPDGADRLMPGLVRIPDVSFVSWDRLPGKKRPRGPIPDLVPDLAVEVLSESNTEQEISRKVREYFDAGVHLVWLIDPSNRTARVHTSARKFTALGEQQTLTGGKVLHGFKLPLRKIFENPTPRKK
jgi:Uma2 family endonuclease